MQQVPTLKFSNSCKFIWREPFEEIDHIFKKKNRRTRENFAAGTLTFDFFFAFFCTLFLKVLKSAIFLSKTSSINQIILIMIDTIHKLFLVHMRLFYQPETRTLNKTRVSDTYRGWTLHYFPIYSALCLIYLLL